MSVPLATIGFFVAGFVFALYAVTFYRSLAGKNLPIFLKNNAYAYFLLAMAFFIWALASYKGDAAFLAASVIMGNALILLGSVFMLTILSDGNKTLQLVCAVAATILSCVFIWLRVTHFVPTPYMEQGILIFNTQRPVAITLGLVFLLIWLPTNLMVARVVTKSMAVEGMGFVYSFIYIISTVAAIACMAFKTVPMVVAAFAVLALCFAMLLFSNHIIKKMVPNA